MGLLSKAVPVRWVRCFNPPLIILLHAGHLFQCSRRRVELLVRNVLRRLFGGRRRLGQSVRDRNGEKPRDGQNCGGERQRQWSHSLSHARLLLTLPPRSLDAPLPSRSRPHSPQTACEGSSSGQSRRPCHVEKT